MNQINLYVEEHQAPKAIPTIVPMAYQAIFLLQEKICEARGISNINNSSIKETENHKDVCSEESIPLWQRYSLSVEEAAKYFGVGENRIYQIIREHPDADFILGIGSHVKLKRVLFEKFLDRATCI